MTATGESLPAEESYDVKICLYIILTAEDVALKTYIYFVTTIIIIQ